MADRAVSLGRTAALAGPAVASGLPTQRLFGIDVEVVDGPGALRWVSSVIEGAERELVFTPNVDHVVRYQRDPAFREAYARAGLVLPDSTPLMWAARVLRRPLAERASNLMMDLCEMAAECGYSVFLLGATPDVVDRAGAELRRRFPAIRIAGRHHGYFRPEEEGDVLAAIDAARPDLLFVGMGSPKQELWTAAHAEAIRCHVAVCVGGAFNYVAGAVARAPAWVQRAGLEWFWRFAHEPRRLFRRYFVEDVAFLRLVAAELAATRAARGRPRAA